MNEIFVELIANTKKKTWVQYLQDDMKDEKEQVIKGLEFEKELENKFREKIESGELEVKMVPSNMIEWANNELSSGNVSAVDGTEVFPLDLISGSFCQIGVGGLSYTNTDPEINVQSITSHISEGTKAGKYFGELLSRKKRLTKFDKDTARDYWELEYCLNRNENWIFRDGNLIPRKLLDYELGINLLKNGSLKNIIGVIKGSKTLRYRLLGRFLRPKEYMIIEGTDEFYREVRLDKTRFKKHIMFNRFGLNFIDKYLGSFKRGIFKAHTKSYVFEIHEDVLNKGIALIMADSLKSPRGIPFLLDLIDTKLRDLFENNYYKEKMYSFLMEKSQEDLYENIDEHELRYL